MVRWSGMDYTVDSTVSLETTELMVKVKMGFLPNVFALNMSMQRHPNTCTHILMFALTQELWINSQALV